MFLSRLFSPNFIRVQRSVLHVFYFMGQTRHDTISCPAGIRFEIVVNVSEMEAKFKAGPNLPKPPFEAYGKKFGKRFAVLFGYSLSDNHRVVYYDFFETRSFLADNKQPRLEANIFNGYVDPDFRGRGIFTAGFQTILKYLQENRYEDAIDGFGAGPHQYFRAIVPAAVSNKAAIKACEKAGMKLLSRHTEFVLFWIRWSAFLKWFVKCPKDISD